MTLMSLKERLDRMRTEQPRFVQQTSDATETESAEQPSASVDTRSHAADTHNRRRGFESIRIHYGAGASITLPYIGLGVIDAPSPETLVLEHSHRTVTITGVRLNELHRQLELCQVEAIRVTSDTSETVYGVEKIHVEKPGGER